MRTGIPSNGMETTPETPQQTGPWQRNTRRPHPRLRAFVGDYEGYSQMVPGLKMLEVPIAAVPLVITFGDGHNIIDSAGRAERHSSFVAGMADSWVVVESGEHSAGIQVNFTPIGARMFLGVSMDSIANRTIELEDVLGHSARHVIEQLQSAPTWDARFDIVDRLIAERLGAAPAASSPVVWAWNKLQASGGNAPIASIAGETGYSHKHLINRFRDEIGLPPKTLSRVLRFTRAVRMIRAAGETVDWLDVASECGYFDQAHLIRDFREFAGMTPADFAARQLPFGGVDGTPI